MRIGVRTLAPALAVVLGVLVLGACSGGGNPSPSASSGGGGTCSAPAWVSTTAYNGGAVVSYNGHQWTAKWWTQGDIPGNNSQNVWTDNGAC